MADQIKDWDPLGIQKSVFTSIPKSQGPGAADPVLAARERELKAKLSASNRKFNPRQFLYEVHKETSHRDLERGLQNLRHAVDQRSVALKTLVQNNFDRFVAARNKIDVLDSAIRGKDPDGTRVYGTVPLEGTLQAASNYASDIYSPIILRRTRAEKIRNTLSLVERFKFYFNLPRSLGEYIAQEKFEAAVREYKKGRELFQSLIASPGADTITAAGSDGTGANQLLSYSLRGPASEGRSNQFRTEIAPALRLIIEKVWLEVEST
ncbi:Exocyst complex component S5, partial [Tieghemiomyces parasiticus]